jgi:hypothetical protein
LKPTNSPTTTCANWCSKRTNSARCPQVSSCVTATACSCLNTAISGLDKIARDAKADETFLDLLKRFAGEGRNVSHNPNSHTNAPAAFAKEAIAKKLQLRKADFEAAMRRLFEAKKIHVEDYGRPSRPYTRITIRDAATA